MQLQSMQVPTKFNHLAFEGYDFGGSRVLVTGQPIHLPEGHENRNGDKLKLPVEIPAGVAFHKRRINTQPSYDLYTEGMEDLRSALMRIKQFEEVTDTEVVMYAREAVTTGVHRVRSYRLLTKADEQRIVTLNSVATRGLNHARNEWKVHASLMLHHAKSIRDKRNRVNPGKTLTQLVAAEEALMIRETEIRGILGYISRDALIAETALWSVRNEFHGIEEAMKSWILRLRDPDHPFLQREERAHLGLAFRACAKRLRERVVMRPYQPSAEWLSGELERFEQSVLECDEDMVRNLLTQVLLVIAAQTHRAKVLACNVELGLVEASPRTGNELVPRLRHIEDELRAAMARGLAGVPTDTREEAKRHLAEVKNLFVKNRSLADKRDWLKYVRDEVRMFARYIA